MSRISRNEDVRGNLEPEMVIVPVCVSRDAGAGFNLCKIDMASTSSGACEVEEGTGEEEDAMPGNNKKNKEENNKQDSDADAEEMTDLASHQAEIEREKPKNAYNDKESHKDNNFVVESEKPKYSKHVAVSEKPKNSIEFQFSSCNMDNNDDNNHINGDSHSEDSDTGFAKRHTVQQAKSAKLQPQNLQPHQKFWTQNPSQIWTATAKTIEEICQLEISFRASDAYVPPPPPMVSAAALRKRKSRKNQALRKEAAALEAELESDPKIQVPNVVLPKFNLIDRSPGLGKGRRDRRKHSSKPATSKESCPPPVARVQPEREKCAFCPSHFSLRKSLTRHQKNKHPTLPLLYTGLALPMIRRRPGEAPAPVSHRALNKVSKCQAAPPLPTAAGSAVLFQPLAPSQLQ
jgi:hypothetical protein